MAKSGQKMGKSGQKWANVAKMDKVGKRGQKRAKVRGKRSPIDLIGVVW